MLTMAGFTIRPLIPADQDWVRQKTAKDWGAEIVVAHSTVFHPAELPGFAAEIASEIVGLLTYNIANGDCEIVTLDSWSEGRGIGTALIEAAKQAASEAKCRRMFLVTTNNNTHALCFYQKRGFTFAAVHINAMEQARKIKPEIPFSDEDGLPIQDEIELEMIL